MIQTILVLEEGSYNNIGEGTSGMAMTVNWDGNGQVFFPTDISGNKTFTMIQREGYTGYPDVGFAIFFNPDGDSSQAWFEEFSNGTFASMDITSHLTSGTNSLTFQFWGGGDPPYTGFECSNLYLWTSGNFIGPDVDPDIPPCFVNIRFNG
jgi:hypothetical protein